MMTNTKTADVAAKLLRRLRHLDRMACNKNLGPVGMERFRIAADVLRCDMRRDGYKTA
jgi:hypothetical protein